MRSEYKRDMNHNYLILHGEQEIDTASYQVRMLVGNVIPSLLKCRMQGIDGEFMVYYDITSRQSVATLYEDKKLGIEDLKLIFGGFVRVMEDMSEYLLNPGQLVIRPEYLYVDMEKGEVYFCYLPGFQKEVREQFQILTEYILPKLDHEDSKAVMLGYGVYRRALEDSFHLEHIKEELYRVREDGEKLPSDFMKGGELPWMNEAAAGLSENLGKFGKYGKYGKTGNRGKPEDDGAFANERSLESMDAGREMFGGRDFSPEDRAAERNGAGGREKGKCERGGIWKKILGCVTAAVVFLGILAVKFLGYLPWLSIEILLGGTLVVIGITMLVNIVIKNRKKKSEKDKNQHGTRRFKGDVRDRPGGTGRLERFSGDYETFMGRDPGGGNLEGFFERNGCGAGVLEPIREKAESENYGETVVLSANPTSGPSSLVSREPGELATIYLKEELTVIGKLETAADAVIPLPTVSRVHAKIRKREGEYYLSDLNSRNGTSVNGRMLKGDEEYLLQDQDEVDFAEARYVFLK